jgi:hypothetical protein
VRQVNHHFRTWRLAARIVALALVLAALPLPALAGEPGKASPAPGLRASIAKAAATHSAALEQAKPAADKAELGSPSFFKKPVGIVVLALVGGGLGYMAYSMSHDRIHSDVRQTQ